MPSIVCDDAYKFNTKSNYLFVHSSGEMEPRELLRALMARDGDNPNSLAVKLRGKVTQPQIYKFVTGTAKEPRRATLQPLADHYQIPVEAFYDQAAATTAAHLLRLGSAHAIGEPRPNYAAQADRDLVIPQYDAAGAMGNGGLVLEEKQPGVIKSWKVDQEWLRLNVRHHTGINNLCIVTGFGPSMKPKYNPGDPLLLDRGVTTVETEGIFFFRVENHGFIKQLQRIPTEAGMVIRAKSLNPDYDPFDITASMLAQDGYFEVFGKVLTVWKSEQV